MFRTRSGRSNSISVARRRLDLRPVFLILGALGCAAAPRGETVSTGESDAEASSAQVRSYLEPNYGATRYAHVTEADMPWRVAIGYPRTSPRYDSRQHARRAAVEGMRLWETAIREHVPWFELEFVIEDPEAPVQIEWKRRMTGSAQGRAGYRCEQVGLGRRIVGHMEIAIRSAPTSQPLSVPEIRLLVAHEFGHVLGLGHCLACDSAMNYAWHTQERVLVTEADVVTFRDLLARPDACRSG